MLFQPQLFFFSFNKCNCSGHGGVRNPEENSRAKPEARDVFFVQYSVHVVKFSFMMSDCPRSHKTWHVADGGYLQCKFVENGSLMVSRPLMNWDAEVVVKVNHIFCSVPPSPPFVRWHFRVLCLT